MLISCKKAAKLVSDSLDHPLTVSQRWRLGIHMGLCGMCRHYRRHMHILKRALRVYRDACASPYGQEACLSHEAKERIRKVLRAP